MFYSLTRSVLLLWLFIACTDEGLMASEADDSQNDAGMRTAKIVVRPGTTRFIQGISDLQRSRYFNLCDPGTGFESRVRDDEMYDYLVKELQISFGRNLGPIKHATGSVQEDVDRAGYADLSSIKSKAASPVSSRMRLDFGGNLDVAAHGAHNAYPDFMGKYETAETKRDAHHPQHLPENIDAAATLAATVLKHSYNDLERPTYFEPVNEPHWAFIRDPHLANWHLATAQKVHQLTPAVRVGGPCMPVCYFYRNDYQSFDGLKLFMANTRGELDFYSFHVYDYLRYRDGEIKGRIQSGLPLEGVLDLVQNHAVNTFGKEIDVVVSETGGYIGGEPKGVYDGEQVASAILAQHDPEADQGSWEFECKKRSIVSFGMLSSVIANTLTFMDHPQTIRKAVPFLLLNTWNWNPRYYAQLYVPHQYQDHSRWVETDLTAFFKLFRDVKGRRVEAFCDDPDLQTRAFVNGHHLYLVVNNQSDFPHDVDLSGIEANAYKVRRLARNPDYTTAYAERTIDRPSRFTLAGRETIVLIAQYARPIRQQRAVNEIVCYGDQIIQAASEANFTVRTPADRRIVYAQLRIGMTRPPETDPNPIVRLNGAELNVPREDAAARFVDREYASTKLIPIDVDWIKPINKVSVSFNDGDEGAVGSVVIRVAVEDAANP